MFQLYFELPFPIYATKCIKKLLLRTTNFVTCNCIGKIVLCYNFTMFGTACDALFQWFSNFFVPRRNLATNCNITTPSLKFFLFYCM